MAAPAQLLMRPDGHGYPPMPLANSFAGRDSNNAHVLGPSLNGRVKQARVLVVGAGGIGCELLKTLVLAGFGEIHIVDLDTVDLSNLNRQFLFHREHIKRPKAEVAREAAQRLNPYTKIVAHYDNISSPLPFGVMFFKYFNVVFNALDNIDARRHVNRMCIFAQVPLIESGTMGFNGQVQVIRPGVTACYDCSTKAMPKSFPVCTIRSTPSQPIHCIVWAKDHLLSEVYGAGDPDGSDEEEDEDGGLLGDEIEDKGDREKISELLREQRDLKKLRQSVTHPNFAQMLFDKVFHAEILRLRSMEDMWQSRTPPEPVLYADVMQRARPLVATRDGAEQILRDSQKVWSLEESVLVFTESVAQLRLRVEEGRASTALQNGYATAANWRLETSGYGAPNRRHDVLADAVDEGEAAVNEAALTEADIQFDKDDIDTLNFVTACANIRATLFGIERKSRFEVKRMAGNIIPAIATTNAIVAGLCVLQSFKVLDGQYDSAREIFLTPFAADRRLASDQLRPPNQDCLTCPNCFIVVRVSASTAVLHDFLEVVVYEYLGYDPEREVCLQTDMGLLYDVEEVDNLDRLICDLGIKEGEIIAVTDDSGNDDSFVGVMAYIEIIDGPLANGDVVEVVDPVEGFTLPRRFPLVDEATRRARAAANMEGRDGVAKIINVEDDDDVMLVEGTPVAPEAPKAPEAPAALESLPKRPREDESKTAQEEQEAKRPKLDAAPAPEQNGSMA